MEFKHRGYTLHQSEENNHYLVFDDSNGKFVLHAQFTKQLTKSEAEKVIDNLINKRKDE